MKTGSPGLGCLRREVHSTGRGLDACLGTEGPSQVLSAGCFQRPSETVRLGRDSRHSTRSPGGAFGRSAGEEELEMTVQGRASRQHQGTAGHQGGPAPARAGSARRPWNVFPQSVRGSDLPPTSPQGVGLCPPGVRRKQSAFFEHLPMDNKTLPSCRCPPRHGSEAHIRNARLP
jgi:hypothetical protein